MGEQNQPILTTASHLACERLFTFYVLSTNRLIGITILSWLAIIYKPISIFFHPKNIFSFNITYILYFWYYVYYKTSSHTLYYIKILSYEQYDNTDWFIIVGAQGTFINSVMYKLKTTDSVVYSFFRLAWKGTLKDPFERMSWTIIHKLRGIKRKPRFLFYLETSCNKNLLNS